MWRQMTFQKWPLHPRAHLVIASTLSANQVTLSFLAKLAGLNHRACSDALVQHRHGFDSEIWGQLKGILSSCVEHRGNSRSWQVRQGCERDAWLDLAEKQKRTPTCNDGCSEKHLNPWCVETALLSRGKESRKRPFLWSEEVWKAIDKPMEEEEEEEVQVHSYWVWTFCQALRVISRRKKKSERRRIKELVI